MPVLSTPTVSALKHLMKRRCIDTMLQRLGYAESDIEYIAVRDNPTYTGTCAVVETARSLSRYHG